MVSKENAEKRVSDEAVFGVDEAGKGPVVGPMVVAAVACDPDSLPKGIRDSKQISKGRRECLAEKLSEASGVLTNVVHVTPAQIDAPDKNMNELTVDAHATALSGVAKSGMTGFADASDTSETRYERQLCERLDVDVNLTAEHGADDSYPIVGAASIVAKVERDRIIAELNESYGDIGSGYPSDQKTRGFLVDYYSKHQNFPDCVRLSWNTCKKIKQEAEQSGLHDF